MDPLSITASVLAVVTAAVKSAKSLYETVNRYKGRDKTLRRLQDELGYLTTILDSLTQVTHADASMLALLQGPIERCAQVCGEFELSMEVFNGKSKTGLRDWAKMEFMRGDINEFIDTVAGYKSTISVGIGTITMHNSKVSYKVLQEYNDLVQDTAYNLELHLRRIDEKLSRFTGENASTADISIDLKDEREVTKQCLRICEDARSYIDSLSTRESSILQGVPQNDIEAQMLTRQALDENRDSFGEVISHLRNRLESLLQNGGPGHENERLRLQKDIDISKQCLDVCKVASEVSRQKIYRVGEAIADGNSDQVVVTTLADLFDVKKAHSNNSSSQLIGSMTAESLHHLTDRRYSSRFGALVGGSDTEAGATSSLPPRTENHEQAPGSTMKRNPPSPNEVRKRAG